MSHRTFRRIVIEVLWDEIEKMAIGLQSGQPEAFEMYGVTLGKLINETSAKGHVHGGIVRALTA
jgi:hypothetical protein